MRGKEDLNRVEEGVLYERKKEGARGRRSGGWKGFKTYIDGEAYIGSRICYDSKTRYCLLASC